MDGRSCLIDKTVVPGSYPGLLVYVAAVLEVRLLARPSAHILLPPLSSLPPPHSLFRSPARPPDPAAHIARPPQHGVECATEMHTDYGAAANVCIYCHPQAKDGAAALWQFVPGAHLDSLVDARGHAAGKRGLGVIFNSVYTAR